MSERVSEAVGPENGDDFLRKVSPTTQRERHPRRSRPPHSHRTPTFDAICNWFGQNTPSRSEDIKISVRPSPHKYAAASTAEKWPLGINRSHPMGGPGRGTTVSTPVEEKEQLEWLRKTGNPPWYLTKCSRECDPPPLTQEEAEMHPLHDMTSSSSERGKSTAMEHWTTSILRSDGPDGMGESIDDSTQYYSAVSSLRSTPSSRWANSDEEDTNNHDFERSFDLEVALHVTREDEMQQMAWEFQTFVTNELYIGGPINNPIEGMREGPHAINIFSKTPIFESGKAMQQQILLRRCFFPRRDVIRWVFFLKDLLFRRQIFSGKTTSFLEPLKSLCNGSTGTVEQTLPV
jgi:hypothetical protein